MFRGSQPAGLVGDVPSGGSDTVLRHPEAVIDLAAITANTRTLRRAAGGADLMAVVKADGYGHGAAAAATAALAGGATMLGVALPSEAVALRDAGVGAAVLAWLWAPGDDIRAAVAAGVHLGVSSVEQLAAVVAAAPAAPADEHGPAGCVPVHIKVDTGMGRGGVMLAQLPALLERVTAAQRRGAVEMVGLMSHLACADVPGDPSIAAQIESFDRAATATRDAGLRPRWRHLANTAGTLATPGSHFDMVRCGIGLYGLSPIDGVTDGLRPAMTLRAPVTLVKRVPAGHGVGYGLTYHTARETTLALVPLGYGDGILRYAGNLGKVWLGDKQRTVAGRVSMDQMVLDCGDDEILPGDEAIVFGPGDRGEPTADDWARDCGTINYEIVSRIGPRARRRPSGGGVE